MPVRFSEVVPGLLYRGGAPDASDVFVLKHKWGIQQIVSLDEKAGRKISDDCARNAIAQVILPVHEHEENGRDVVMDNINSTGVTDIVRGKVTYVHCKHGKDRTGMFVGRFRTENGWNSARAVAEAVTFGFGTGVDDHTIGLYLDVINGGPDAGKPVTLDDWKQMSSQYTSSCVNCGMRTTDDDLCNKCSGVKSVLNNLVESSRGDVVQNVGDSTHVSNLWNVEENVSAASLKYNTQTRRGVVKALLKAVTAQQIAAQEVSKPIGESEHEQTKKLIENLNSFVKLIDALIENQIAPFVDLFKNAKGITYEMLEEIEAEPYFINLGKNLKKNVWRIVGDRYIDLMNEIDEDKEKKDNTQTAVQKKINERSSNTIFDLCLDGLSSFNKDTHIGPMQKSLEESVKGLADLIVDFADYMENDMRNNEMQKHISDMLTAIQDQVATISTLIKDRIIYTLNKDVLGKEKMYNEDKSTNSVLHELINNEV